MDSAGFAGRKKVNALACRLRVLFFLPVIPFFSFAACGQTTGTAADRVAAADELARQEKWTEIVESVSAGPADPAELDFDRGLALAHLKRLGEARASFEAGLRKSPEDKRFRTELAGVAYEQKDFGLAKRDLRGVLKLDPHDTYALDFLGTLYFLDDNLEAALLYWNREGKPKIEGVRTDPALEVRPELFDRALAFAPLDVMRLQDLQTSEARLRNLEIFERADIGLSAKADGSYDAVVRAAERDGWGDGWADALISTFRGLPYETVFPAYSNFGHEAINANGMLRWDDQMRRLSAELAMPVRKEPWWRLRFFVDARNENWNLSRSLAAASSPFPALNLQRQEAGFEMRRVQSGRWNWSTAASVAHRSYRNVIGIAAAAQAGFTDAYSLEYRAQTNYTLLDNPMRRMRLDVGASGEIARAFQKPLGDFGKVQASAAFHWFPQARGEDYEMTSELRAGGLFGSAPFDEVFMLGIERDNDLWLRGTVGTQDGQKGSAPMGRRYALWNWSDDKIVYRNAFVMFRIGPFLDIGRVTDPSGVFADSGWRVDPGIELKVKVLGSVEAVFYFGRDLRAGRNAFYGTAN